MFGFMLAIFLGNVLAIFSLIFSLNIQEMKHHNFKKGEVIWTLKNASPLMIHNLTSTIQTNFDRAFLSLYVASGKFSEYLTSVIWGGTAGIIVEIVYAFWATRILSRNLTEQDFNIELSRFRRSFIVLTLQISMMILILGYLGSEFIGIGERHAKIAFTCIVATALIRIVFFLNLVVSLKNGQAINVSKATILGSCVMVLASVVLIPIFGFYGGVITTVFSFIAQSYSLSYFNGDKLLKLNILVFLPSYFCFVMLGGFLIDLGVLALLIIKNHLVSGAFKK
jgi:hypothetical protein